MSIQTSINKSFSIRREEQTAVYLLLVQTIFLGVFFALFDISATSLFINTFGEKMLSKAFLISGILGFSLTAVYYRLQIAWKFSKLILLNLLTIAITTFLIRLLFYASDNDWLIFIVFIMMGPLNLLGLVGFWGMAGRLFTLRQGKRLFGLIDSGQIFGMILISFSIPFLLGMLKSDRDLLYISSLSVFIAFIIQLFIVRKFDLNKQVVTKKEEEKLKLSSLLKDRYLLNMTMYVVLSMISAFIMFYIFLPTTKMLYPGDNEYTVFLGMFTGTLMIFTFLIKTLAYDKITKNYGLRVNLLLPPILLTLFVVLAIGSGLIFGFSPASTSFVLFFLFVALGRLFSVSLKNSIEVPSQKLLYQSLDSSIRHKVQVAIDGMVNEISAILAGIFLFILGVIEFFTTIHYAYFLIGIAGAWALVGFNVYREYRKSLGAALSTSTSTDFDLKNEDDSVIQLTQDATEERMQKKLEIAPILEPFNYQEVFRDGLLEGGQTRAQALKIIQEGFMFDSLPTLEDYVNKTSAAEDKDAVQELINTFQTTIEKEQKKIQLSDLVSSVYPADRVKAAQLIGYTKKKRLTGFIVVLLRDYAPEVKHAAIKTAALVQDETSINLIIDLLSDEQYNASAYEALKRYGRTVKEQLEQYFYKSGLKTEVQLQIIELFARMGSQATRYLENKLDHSSGVIVDKTIEALYRVGYSPKSASEKQKLQQLVKKRINIIVWNLNIKIQLNTDIHGDELLEAMQQEVEKGFQKIFVLLSVLYEPESVNHVKNNLDIGTSESISYAIELLDLFVDEEIKPLLLILFDDITEAERIRRFSDHFAMEKSDEKKLIEDIINRDINEISRHTKACALDILKKMKDVKIGNSAIAQMFNPDILLAELAAMVVAHHDYNKFESVINRLDAKRRHHFQQLSAQKNISATFDLFKQARELPIFKEIPAEKVIYIIENSVEFPVEAGNDVRMANIGYDTIIVIEGEIQLPEKETEQRFTPGDIITHTYYGEQLELVFRAIEKSVILRIPFSIIQDITRQFDTENQLLSRIL